MTNLVVTLLAAALSTNPPVAISNLVADSTGVRIPIINTNDPVERAYYQVLQDDDAAEKDILKWTDDAQTFSEAGGGASDVTMQSRIQQRIQGVKTEYENFIRLHPDHARIRLAYGSFLNDIKDEEGSVEQWEKSRELDPKNPAAWNNLANYYGHRSPVKKAFQYYAKAIELDNTEAVYYRNMATTVYLFRKDAEEYYKFTETQVFDFALDLYRKAIKLTPDDFILYTDYAESYYGIRPPRLQDGLDAWKGALKIAHDDTERQGVYIHLARFNLKLGNLEAARSNIAMVNLPMYDVLKKRVSRNVEEAFKERTEKTPAPATK